MSARLGFAAGLALGIGAALALPASRGSPPPAEERALAASASERMLPAAPEAPPAMPPPPPPAAAVPASAPEDGAPVAGRVLLADGAPLEGVEVRARRAGPDGDEGGEAPPTPVEARATTDAAGRFVLRAPRGLAVLLEAAKGGFAFERWTSRLSRSEVPAGGAEAIFYAYPAGAVTIDVDGAPPSGAVVTFHPDAGDQASVRWSPSDRTAWLEPGGYRAVATAAPGLKSGSARLVVPSSGGAPVPVRLALLEEPGLRGRVSAPADAGGVRGRVQAWRRSGEKVLYGGECGIEDGRYRISGLAAGTYEVGACWPDKRPRAVKTVDVTRLTECDLDLPPLERRDLVAVTIEPAGAAIDLENDWLELDLDPSASDSDHGTALRRADGSTWIVIPDHVLEAWRDPGRPRKLAVELRSRASGSYRAEVAPGDAPAVTIRLDPPALLTATIPGYEATGVAGEIEVRLVPEGEDYAAGERPDPSGRIRFDPVKPGRYRLTAQLPVAEIDAAGTSVAVLDLLAVDLAAGERRIDLPLPRLCEVTIRAPGPGAIALEAQGDAGGYVSAISRDGAARFRHVPAGTYVAALRRKGTREATERMTLILPGPSEVGFVADPSLPAPPPREGRQGPDQRD